MSDPDVTFEAMRGLDLAVHIATKLNRTHLLVAKQSFILPCLGRTEIDMQASGPAIGHGRGFDVDGACVTRRPQARF